MPDKPQPINWPKLVIGQQAYTLRVTFSTWYRLAEWGLSESYNPLQFAAACAGHYDQQGRWHSAEFSRPQDLADLITDTVGEGDAGPLIEQIKTLVEEAQKKARRQPESLPQPAAQTAA